MVKPIVKDILFLGQKSVPATQLDMNVVNDLRDTLAAYFRGLSDFGHFSVAMAKNEIIRIGPLILIILHHHFASKQFGHGHLGQL